MTQIARPALAPAAQRGWWLFVVRGLLALAVGIIAIVDPGATLAAVILLLGAFFIVDGSFAVVKAFRVMRCDRSWWYLLLSGIIGIAAGVAVVAWPGLTSLTLGYFVAFWAIVTGIFEVVAATSMRRVIRGAWLYVFFGALSIAFGGFVVLVPGFGIVYLVLLIAIYGFAAGLSLTAFGLRLRLRGSGN